MPRYRVTISDQPEATLAQAFLNFRQVVPVNGSTQLFLRKCSDERQCAGIRQQQWSSLQSLFSGEYIAV